MVHLGSVTFAFLSGHLEGRNSQKIVDKCFKVRHQMQHLYIYPRKNKDNMNNALERATKIRKGKTGVGSLQLNSYSF